MLAEREGFEPPSAVKPEAVFKTAAIDHSATSPQTRKRSRIDASAASSLTFTCIPLRAGRAEDSNPQPTVLETATLPIELPPYTVDCVSVADKKGAEDFNPRLHKSSAYLSDDFASRDRRRWCGHLRGSRSAGLFPWRPARCSSISTETLSPGITISTPVGRVTVPVTSVVRK